MSCYYIFLFFFFNDTATTEIYTLSLHDALPICERAAHAEAGARAFARAGRADGGRADGGRHVGDADADGGDRKSTRLNSSHSQISYAVFCLKKKKIAKSLTRRRN